MSDHADDRQPRAPFRDYRERLAALGFRPSSARGQNFLLDATLHRWIAEQAGPGSADTVVEVGVGLGFLTRELAARAARVVAVEIDPRLLAVARADLADCGNIEWVEGDALGGPGATLLPAIGAAGRAAGGRLLVVANLPYSVSGPVLAELAQLDSLADRIVVLVQRELARRLAAAPGTPDYAGLGVLLQSVYHVRSLRDVSPQVFRPRPKVWSTIVALDLRADRPEALRDGAARRTYARFVRALFAQRRKVLRTTYPAAAAAVGAAPAAPPAELAALRAEALSPAAVLALWQSCSPPRDGGR